MKVSRELEGLMTPKMHKAAIEAAKHEASCEMLELVVDLLTMYTALKGEELQASRLEVLREWQQIHDDGRRRAVDAFVLLIQEKLRVDVGRL